MRVINKEKVVLCMKSQWKKDLISIVIPVYNAAPYLERALDSVLNQTYTEWELALFDDGSLDNSREVIIRWLAHNAFYESKQKNTFTNGKHQIHLLGDEINHGAAYARNKGNSITSGQYLVYLDADDFWTLDKLEKQYHFMKEKGCAFSFTGYAFANAKGVRTGKEVHVPATITYAEALTNTTISTITVMFDRGQIPTELLWMPEDCEREDTATWWKILKRGYVAYGLDEIMSVYCRHRDSHSANKVKAVLGTYRMYRVQEKLNVLQAITCMMKYVYGAVKRRL